MTWVAVGVGVAGVAGSTITSMFGSSKAKKAQESAQKALDQRLNQSADEVAQYSQDYVDFITKLDNDFDPYDVEDAFNSLYEAVIQPMERDFDENVLPGIQQAYSGGIMGAGAGMSGAQASAESQAERGLSEKKADLRYQERGQAIAQNYADFDRRSNLAGSKLSAQTAAPMLRAGQAPMQYQAETDTIAARLASTQQLAGGIGSIGNLGMQASNMYQQNNNTNSLRSALDMESGSNAERSRLQYMDYVDSLGR